MVKQHFDVVKECLDPFLILLCIFFCLDQVLVLGLGPYHRTINDVAKNRQIRTGHVRMHLDVPGRPVHIHPEGGHLPGTKSNQNFISVPCVSGI